MSAAKIQGTLRLNWKGNWIETSLEELQRGLRGIGLHLVSDADKRVLDAMWAIPDGTLAIALRAPNADNWVSLPGSVGDALRAERARRTP